MNDPFKTSANRQTSASGTSSAATDSAGLPALKVRKRRLRPWLFFALIVVLLVVLTVRDDLRQQAAQSSESAVRYLAFDLLGVSPRDVFVWRLRLAGLLDSPLGQQWVGAVERASDKPVRVGDRYRTSKVFTADQVEAHVYQLALKRGEKLLWQLSCVDTSASRLYASLERYASDKQGWSSVAQMDASGEISSRVISEPGNYRLVLQPELFAQVEYSLAIATGGSLPFPVEGAAPRDIGSSFGVARDGGARQHHGVDIFAKRGTPVTAVVDGRVRTCTAGIGGNHVWLAGGMLGVGSTRYYYAHLDTFAIASGDTVKQGDVLGFVGNTGNARTTPAHLHFGIYSGGPVDPAPFLKPEPLLPEG